MAGNPVRDRIRMQAANAGRAIANGMHVLNGHNQVDLVVDNTILNGKRVVKINNATESTFHLPVKPEGTAKLTKVFLTNSASCILNLNDKIITQHLELSHCEGITINVNVKLLTLQIDLCKDVQVNYSENLFDHDTKIIHAGVEGLKIVTHEGHEHETNYSELVDLEHNKVSEADEVSAEERQFMTVLANGELKTRRIFKQDGHLIPTVANSNA